MKIITARWTPQINLLLILCSCQNGFEHRADRWRVCCPHCGRVESLHQVRLQRESIGAYRMLMGLVALHQLGPVWYGE